MSKKRQSQKQSPIEKKLKKVPAIWQGVIAVVIVAVGIIGVSMWNSYDAEAYDLSKVGKGQNVVVQIHDHNCPLCRELKANVEKVLPEYEGRVEYVIADVAQKDGRHFAQFHQVGTVTLLFFRPDGSRITSINGVQDEEFLRNAIDRSFNL